MDPVAATVIACDPDAPARRRVEALVEVVENAALTDTPVPPRIGDAIDDPAVVDAAIAMKRTSHLCAALHLLGTGADLLTTRKRVVRRMIAAGAGGIELAGLAIDIGDVQPAATIAAKDFAVNVVPRIVGGPPEAVIDAWLGWLAMQPDTAVVAILRKIEATSAPSFDTVFAFAANPDRAARLHRLARSNVAS